MEFVLGEQATRAGYRVVSFETIGSTNAEALKRARAGDPGQLWLTTREQTEGRGRRGRVWDMPAGNLAASCLIILDDPPAQPATLGFVAGLSLYDAVTALAPETRIDIGLDGVDAGQLQSGERLSRFALKWPNDVVANGAKIAGILLEAENLSDGRLAIVTGIGVNVVAAPQGTSYQATTINAIAPGVDAEALFAQLSDHWAAYAALWETGGFSAIRQHWLERATGLGEVALIKTENGVVRGIFETIDRDGRLIIRRDDGSAALVSAGDVHFGVAATAHGAT